MNALHEIFLQILSETLRNVKGNDPDLTAGEWAFMLEEAQKQDILPLILDAVVRHPSFGKIEKETKTANREKTLQDVARQLTQTNEFLTLLLHAQSQGFDPIVLKGITVRSLYPKPYLRPSVDEDILVSRDQAESFYAFLVSEGLTPDDPARDPMTADEISFHKPNSPTYIEMHLSLFETDSVAYGELNDLFTGAEERTVRQQIEDVSLRTLHPTDHLLYLICHVYKHFLHSGAGIRQFADIGMLAREHEDEIDWTYIEEACKKVHIETFAAAVFKIIRKYLIPELTLRDHTKTVPAFSSIRIDEAPLLEDVLEGGIYGLSAPERVHSVNITLSAAEASKQGNKRTHGVWKSLFPGNEYLQTHYTYCREKPILIPVAWGHRIVNYVRRTPRVVTNTVKTIRAGKDRTALLKKYKIVK